MNKHDRVIDPKSVHQSQQQSSQIQSVCLVHTVCFDIVWAFGLL